MKKYVVIPKQALRLIDKNKNTMILDIRDEKDFEEKRIYGSKNIEAEAISRFETLYPNHPKYIPIIVLCYRGIISTLSVKCLRSKGFCAYNLEGGLEEWEHSFYPLDKPNSTTEFKIPESDQSMASRTLGEMSADIFHEIKNPITVISGRVESLRDNIEENSENPMVKEVCELLDVEKTILGINHSISLINNMMNSLNGFFYNLQCAKDFKKIKLIELMQDIEEMVQFKTRYISFKFQYDEYCKSLKFEGIAQLYYQILLNLINNAVDAIDGQKNPWIVCELSFHIASETLKLSVIDCGKGIPVNIQKHIFDRHFTTKPKGKGTGLGMSIVKDLLDSMNGKIEIDNKQLNTCIKLEIPLKEAEFQSNNYTENETNPELSKSA